MNKDSVRGESTWTCSSLKSEERETRLCAYGTSLSMIALTALMLLLMASAYAAELTTYGPLSRDSRKGSGRRYRCLGQA
jgi:hypothetical protein